MMEAFSIRTAEAGSDAPSDTKGALMLHYIKLYSDQIDKLNVDPEF